MTCFDSQVIRRMTVFVLDECGRIPTDIENDTPALKGLADAIQTLEITRNVDIPTTTPTKVVSGRTCNKPRPNPTDNGFSYAITFCGSNPLFEAATGYKTIQYDGEDIVGFIDVNIAGTTSVALEIIFEPTSDSCVPGEQPQCRAVLIPRLEQWAQTTAATYNGDDVPDLVMTGQSAVSASIFGNYSTVGELPTYLSAWADEDTFEAINDGVGWQYTRFIDCPPEDTESACVFSPIETGS